MNRISLETRLMRIRSGLCSSPDHIISGLRTFADMPVIAMISKIFPDLEKGFINLMSLHFDINAQEITYGDLAVLIAEDYLRNGIRSEKYIDALILYYCTCFEFRIIYENTVKEQANTLPRDQYLGRLGLQDIRGITDLRMDEYLDEIRKLDMPESTVKWLYAFSIEKKGMLIKDLNTVYTLMREYAFAKDVRLLDPISAGYSSNSTLIRRQLIELLIMPIACLVTDAENENTYDRKESENEYE